jgi:hypothetical protein
MSTNAKMEENNKPTVPETISTGTGSGSQASTPSPLASVTTTKNEPRIFPLCRQQRTISLKESVYRSYGPHPVQQRLQEKTRNYGSSASTTSNKLVKITSYIVSEENCFR